jgi:hypothetical protein
MVEGWLKLELIHQFFEALSDKEWQDTGRFEFWCAYHEQMDEVYFALSRAAFRSTAPDLKQFITAADGLIFKLTQSTRENHAFIMCIDDRAVVEFSAKGNAAYFYGRRDLNLSPTGHAISMGEFKRKDRAVQMRHAGTKAFSWQELFARELSKTISPSLGTTVFQSATPSAVA